MDRDDAIHLESASAACVEKVSAVTASGEDLKATWKLGKPDELEVQIPLKNQAAGHMKLKVKQYGLAEADELSLRSYAEAAHLERFTINAGDRQGVLKGTRLDEVDSAELKGIRFVPAKFSRADQKDELQLVAAPQAAVTPTTAAATASETSTAPTNAAAASQGSMVATAATASPVAAPVLQADEKLVAKVALTDGRVLELQTTVAAARPKVSLMSKSVQRGAEDAAIRFGKDDEMSPNDKLSFFVKSEVPEKFAHNEKIEVATADESAHVLLSEADGSLILQDAQTALAIFSPAKGFSGSAFGPLRFRVVDSEGVSGDWMPLGNLVRVPQLKEIRCPDKPDQKCKLSGGNLFLIDAVASDAEFKNTVPVPAGFVDSSLSVPRPNGTLLYLKLRDDPSTVNMAVLPVLPAE